AIMAGSNVAAKRGILIRDGVALEKAGEVTAVLFDKTGTLTAGKPRLAKVWEVPGVTQQQSDASSVAQIASTLARNSGHPVSQALASLHEQELPVEHWEEVHGAGLQANVRWTGRSVPAKLGSLRWLKDSGVDLASGEAFVQE